MGTLSEAEGFEDVPGEGDGGRSASVRERLDFHRGRNLKYDKDTNMQRLEPYGLLGIP